MADHREGVTLLLREWRRGDAEALARLTPIVYRELHALAAGFLRRQRVGHTLQPTALIGEAFLRLLQNATPDWSDRAHFLAVAATCMRQILVDHARRKSARKRGGRDTPLTLDEALAPGVAWDPTALLEVDDALRELAGFDPRKAHVIEMRYFGGMTQEEIAGALDVHAKTVERDLRLAQIWLKTRLRGSS